jgi:superfamily I DNA and RNA helicase
MLEPDLSQHDIPSACVIVQQYSSATFVLWRLYSQKKKGFSKTLIHSHPSVEWRDSEDTSVGIASVRERMQRTAPTVYCNFILNAGGTCIKTTMKNVNERTDKKKTNTKIFLTLATGAQYLKFRPPDYEAGMLLS